MQASIARCRVRSTIRWVFQSAAYAPGSSERYSNSSPIYRSISAIFRRTRSRSTTCEPGRQQALLAQAEVVKHARGRGLVRVAAEGDAIENDVSAHQDSSGDRERRRVQDDQIHRIGAKMERGGARRFETRPCGIYAVLEVTRNIDIAPWSELAGGRAAEQIGELDSVACLHERGRRRAHSTER